MSLQPPPPCAKTENKFSCRSACFNEVSPMCRGLDTHAATPRDSVADALVAIVAAHARSCHGYISNEHLRPCIVIAYMLPKLRKAWCPHAFFLAAAFFLGMYFAIGPRLPVKLGFQHVVQPFGDPTEMKARIYRHELQLTSKE